MKRRLIAILLAGAMLIFSSCAVSTNSSVIVKELRCEYLADPLGIDVVKPRLSWILESGQRGQKQSACQILVADSKENLKRNKGNLWDTGKVESNQSIHMVYNGEPLKSRMQCFWKVRVWDKDGKVSAWSEPAMWSMGILHPKDWKGQWVKSDLELKDYQKELKALPDYAMEKEHVIWRRSNEIRKMTAPVKEASAVWMRKEFRAVKTVRRATAYICGLGLHELYLNGKRIGDEFLNPAVTDYQKRCFYITYDVTKSIRRGDNVMGVILGNGWYNPVIPGALRSYTADYIDTPRLLIEIDIEYVNGTRQTVAGNQRWKFTTDGPIRFNSLMSGETYDARKELGDWTKAGYDDSGWKPAIQAKAPEGKLVSQQLFPVRKVKEIPAVSVVKQGSGYRFDIGVETVGWARIKIRAKAGKKITIDYPGSGSHTLGRYQKCEYICKGGEEEIYEPRFCYNGYRFVDVNGLDYTPKVSDLTGQMVCTDMEFNGEFACSHEKLTRLQKILRRTIRNYIVHIPNDPVREKSGWTQDVQTGFEVNAYNFNAATMYRKWQYDFLDAIHNNGYVPTVAPGRFDGPTINGPWWGGMIVYNPWQLYKFYGDKQILAESYVAMKSYLGYLDSISQDHIVSWGLGDWMDIGSEGRGRPQLTPVELTSTCAYFLHTDIVSRTAAVLGKTQEANEYARDAEKIRRAYNKKYLNPATGQYATGSQTAQVLSLHIGLVPEDAKEKAVRYLKKQIAKDNNHLSTGFVATPYLLNQLSDLGIGELAYTIATQESYPSWFDMVFNHGHSVLKENWQGGLVQMPSLAGPIGAWYFYSLGGIRPDPSTVAFRKIIIKPEIVGDIKWVRCCYDSMYGRIVSNWRYEDEKLIMDVRIPANSTATIYVPAKNTASVTESGKAANKAEGVRFLRMETGSAVFAVGSGQYQFVSKLRL